MNKTCKSHKIVLLSELILCNYTKAIGKKLFLREHCDANFQTGLQKCVILAGLYSQIQDGKIISHFLLITEYQLN